MEYNSDKMSEFAAWLHETIAFWCDDDGVYVIEPSSYDDVISPQTLGDAFRRYLSENKKETMMPFRYFLQDYVGDNLFPSTCLDDEFVKILQYSASNPKKAIPMEMLNTLKHEDLIEMAYNEGYNGATIDLDAFLNSTYRLNIMLRTKGENDGDIYAMFNCNDCNGNAVGYLIRQQGYKPRDVVDAFKLFTTDEDKFDLIYESNKFVKSVMEEMSNITDMDDGVLTVLISGSGLELCDAMEKLAKRSDNDKLTVSKDSLVGFFSSWSGNGSYLDIQLEEPFTFPASMVDDIQIEGSNFCGYTVEHTYGYNRSFWNGKISF